jgi:hypothetical protein
MPYDIRIIRSEEFIRLDAQGIIDLPISQRLMSDAIWACVHSKIGRVLLDLRKATAHLTAAQLAALAEACRTMSLPHEDRIAILTTPEDEFKRAAFLARCVRDQGWNLAAFSDFEQAFDWLCT